jgi:hypothetical protein
MKARLATGLSPMAKDAQEILGKKRLEVVADRGYYNGDEIRACELAGMDAYVPKSTTSPNKAKASSIAPPSDIAGAPTNTSARPENG